MIWKTFILLLIGMLFLNCEGTVEVEDTHSLFCTSTPIGAAISIDNVPTGYLTPYLLTGIQTGEHTIKIYQSIDHSELDTTIDFNENSQIDTLSAIITPLWNFHWTGFINIGNWDSWELPMEAKPWPENLDAYMTVTYSFQIMGTDSICTPNYFVYTLYDTSINSGFQSVGSDCPSPCTINLSDRFNYSNQRLMNIKFDYICDGGSPVNIDITSVKLHAE